MYTMAERVRRLDLVNKLKTCGYDIKYIDIYKSVASTMKKVADRGASFISQF